MRESKKPLTFVYSRYKIGMFGDKPNIYCGTVAQLGEHTLHVRGVMGSSPLGSISASAVLSDRIVEVFCYTDSNYGRLKIEDNHSRGSAS